MRLLVLAHPRSGHHALIDWYCSNYGKWVIHVNDPQFVGRHLHPSGKIHGHVYAGSKRETFRGKVRQNIGDMVVNFEQPNQRPWFPDWWSVVVIRDFTRFLSSAVHLAERDDNPELLDKMVPAWDWCANKVIGGSKFVLFDRWASEEDYRLRVADTMGVDAGPKPWLRVSPFGGGSSYTGVKDFRGAPAKSVTSRDESHSPLFNRYATKERLALNKQIWNLA